MNRFCSDVVSEELESIYQKISTSVSSAASQTKCKYCGECDRGENATPDWASLINEGSIVALLCGAGTLVGNQLMSDCSKLQKQGESLAKLTRGSYLTASFRLAHAPNNKELHKNYKSNSSSSSSSSSSSGGDSDDEGKYPSRRTGHSHRKRNSSKRSNTGCSVGAQSAHKFYDRQVCIPVASLHSDWYRYRSTTPIVDSKSPIVYSNPNCECVSKLSTALFQQ